MEHIISLYPYVPYSLRPLFSTLYFGELYEGRGGVGTLHVFAGNQRLASVFADGTGKIQFYHGNHLGSASVITDQYGGKKEQIEYFPYGTYRAVGNINGTYDFDPAFPDVFYTFTDQEDDDDLGLYNFKARLYDPLLGRFISPDSLVPDPTDPQALNRYSYARNNPLIYKDPTGHLFTPYHGVIQLGVSLLSGRFLLSFVDAIQAMWTDVYQGKAAAEANLHAMRGYLEEMQRYQTIDEAKAGARILAEQNLQEGKYGVGGHGVQDAPGHKWESMGDYAKRAWSVISHTLKDIFPSPATLWGAIKNTWNLMKDPEGTINKVYAVDKVSSNTPPVDLSGPSDTNVGLLSGDFSSSDFSQSFYDSWSFDFSGDFWSDSWGDSWGDSWD